MVNEYGKGEKLAFESHVKAAFSARSQACPCKRTPLPGVGS